MAVILLGNDGVGKSTLCEYINSIQDEYMIFERSMTNFKNNHIREFHKLIKFKEFDKVTLDPFWKEHRYEFPTEINNVKLYFVIIDSDISDILTRIDKREYCDIWETPKSLNYFRHRFREISGYYGFPLIFNGNSKNIQDIAKEIINIIVDYDDICAFSAKNIMREQLISESSTINVENCIRSAVHSMIDKFDSIHEKVKEELKNTEFELLELCDNINKAKMISRYIINQNMCIENNTIYFIDKKTKEILYCQENKLNLCIVVTEGESKKIFKRIHKNPYFNKLCIILLKSTIYSHSRQATGEIESLGAIRGQGTQLYLEMMWRNNLSHCYRSVNLEGVIISDFLNDIPPTEIVGKFNCEGTDKHSYYGIRYDSSICLENGEYKSCLYTRIDWRNPNHVSVKTGKACTENTYYYVVEEIFGKEKFFETYLRDLTYFKPYGDKTIYADIIHSKINVDDTISSLVKIMFTIKSYLNKIKLDVQDACFMMNKNGDTFWSEINQDCMRIKALENSDDKYDKDIWRTGGSSSKDLILEKWKIFNNLLRTYLEENLFHNTEIYSYNEYNYEKLLEETLNSTKYNITPQYKQIYNNLLTRNKLRNVLIKTDTYNISKCKYFPDVMLCVNEINNSELDVIEQNYTFVYKNDYTKEEIKTFIHHSARRLIINYKSELISFVPFKRSIIYCEDNWNPETINKLTNLSDCIMFSTFNKLALLNLSKKFKKIYIEINNMSDFYELLKYDRVVPVIESHIIENKYDISDIYIKMLDMNSDETYNVIFQDISGNIIEFSRLNKENFRKIFDDENIGKILVNDSGNSVIVTINNTTNKTKFNTQSVVKSNILTLNDSIDFNSNSKELLPKIIDGFYKISNLNTTPNIDDINDMSSFLINYLSYMKSKNITLEKILNRMNANKWDTFKNKTYQKTKSVYKIGITGEKYSSKTDLYIEQNLGIKLTRPTNRSMEIVYKITDKEKYHKFFDKEVIFVPLRPKDMVYQYSNCVIDGFISYNTVIDNYPNVLNCIDSVVDNDICVCLLKKKDHVFNSKLIIAAEHYTYVKEYFSKKNIESKIINVIGSSETFIINNSDNYYDLCDAIVESGKTIEDNNLEIYDIIKERGTVRIGLYM